MQLEKVIANEGGNELTYYQAMILFDYFTQQLGFDNVMAYFFNDVPFAEWFGMDYTEALSAAVDFFG